MVKSIRFILFLLIFFNFSNSIISAEYENHKVKKFNVKFYKDGEWKRIGKKSLSNFGSSIYFEYWGQFRENKLTRLVETIWMLPSSAHLSESQKFFQDYTFQRSDYKSCVHRNSYLAFELHRSNKVNCYLARIYNPKKEIYNPMNRISHRINTNHGPRIMKKYFEANNIKLPDTMLRAEHVIYTMNYFYAYYEMAVIEEELVAKNETTPENLSDVPNVKKFLKDTAENHLLFQDEIGIVDKVKFSLSQYINVDIKLDKTKVVKVKKDNIEKTDSLKIEETLAKIDTDLTVIKSDANREEKKEKKIRTVSNINNKFFKLKKGDIIEGNLEISSKSKIPLPVGKWKVANKKKIAGWHKSNNIILVKENADERIFDEFIEVSVSDKDQMKNYEKRVKLMKQGCELKLKNGAQFYDVIKKSSGSGNAYSCYTSGYGRNENLIPQRESSGGVWHLVFNDHFSYEIPSSLLFSMSAYTSPRNTSQRHISVFRGASLDGLYRKYKEAGKNDVIIKNIWTRNSIDFHENFQNNMNLNENHKVDLDNEYFDLENSYAKLMGEKKDTKKKVAKKVSKIKKEPKEKKNIGDSVDQEKKKIAEKKAEAERRKKLAEKKIEEEKKKLALKKAEEEKRLAEIKAKEEAENQKLLAATTSQSEEENSEKSVKNKKNFLEALAKKEVLEDNKKKIIRYECQQPWDLTTEDYRPLLDIYELDLTDRILKGTHRYITDKEYTEERTYPILAKDKDRVLVRYDSPNGNFSTKFFFNYGTDQSIVAVDNSYRTQAKCVNRDYFVDIQIAKKKDDNINLSENDLKALEDAKKEALLAEKEIKEIEKEQKQLALKQEKILKKQKQKTETAKVAKLKIYKDPKKLNKSLFSSISKSQFKKYNATSTVSYLFFESSENYLISLELLYRAYDLNTEAEKIRSHISYMKESKSSEKQRLQSTQQIVQSQTNTIKSNIQNDSIILSEQGKVYYAQSLPYALNAAIATYNLYHVAMNTVNNVGNSGDIVFGVLYNLNNVIGIAQILPQLPGYSKNMYKTTKLIITGAKAKKIKESASTKKALDDLNLNI